MKKVLYLGHLGMRSYGDQVAYDLFESYIDKNFRGSITVVPKHLKIKGDKLPVIDPSKFDFVLLGGGTCITNMGRSFDRMMNHISSRNILPFGILGSGVYFPKNERPDQRREVTKTSEGMVREYIMNSTFTAVRDAKSKEYLLSLVSEASIQVLYDPALTVQFSKIVIPREKSIIGVNLCETHKGTPGDVGTLGLVYERIYRFIEEYSKQYTFMFLCFNQLDKKFFPRMVDLGVQCFPFKSTEYIAGVIQNCSYFIGMRVHSDVTCVAYSIPFRSITYTYPNVNFLDHIQYSYRTMSDMISLLSEQALFERLRRNEQSVVRSLHSTVKAARSTYVREVEKLCQVILNC